MKSKLPIIFLLILFISDFPGIAFSQDSLSDEDLQYLQGSWTGTLTYLDYTTNIPYSMPSDVEIVRIDSMRNYLFKRIYPDEPKANSYDTVAFSLDGAMINDEKIVSKKYLQNGTVEFITEINGIDGNDVKPALIRHNYTLGEEIFIISKDVKFKDQSDWINRHVYKYKRSHSDKR